MNWAPFIALTWPSWLVSISSPSKCSPGAGWQTYYVLFLHLETRRVTLAAIAQHPTEEWLLQMAPNAVDVIDGTLLPVRHALHHLDTKFCTSFRTMLQCDGVQPILLPPRSANLNAFAERCVRSIKHECLSKLILVW